MISLYIFQFSKVEQQKAADPRTVEPVNSRMGISVIVEVPLEPRISTMVMTIIHICTSLFAHHFNWIWAGTRGPNIPTP